MSEEVHCAIELLNRPAAHSEQNDGVLQVIETTGGLFLLRLVVFHPSVQECQSKRTKSWKCKNCDV